MAMTSRLNSDSSMPPVPCVTPSHIAGTPPANCATAPASRAAAREQRRVSLKRLVRREHVVVGRDDADVRPCGAAQRLAVRACPPRPWRGPGSCSRARPGGSRSSARAPCAPGRPRASSALRARMRAVTSPTRGWMGSGFGSGPEFNIVVIPWERRGIKFAVSADTRTVPESTTPNPQRSTRQCPDIGQAEHQNRAADDLPA